MSAVTVFRGASCAVLALLSVPAFADEAPDPHDHITVVGHPMAQAEAEVLSRPGGVEVISAESYRDVLAVSLRDALAFSPGVYAQPRFGQEVRLSIRGSGISRGFHMRGLMLLQDGVPINLADNNGDFQELDPQVFDHIEVYRGANALRYGASTLGGGINAWTPTGESARGFEARIDGGSYNTLRTKVAAGFVSGPGDAYLAFTTDRGDGDRLHSDRRGWRFNGNVGLRVTDRLETRFYATVSHIRQDLNGAITRGQALSDPRQVVPAAIANDQERNIDSVRLQNRTVLHLDNGTLEGGVFLNSKSLYHPIFQVIDQDSLDYGVYGRLTLKGEVGGIPVEGTIGATARFGHVDGRQYVNVRGERGALTQVVRQNATTVDGYGELRLTPVAGLSLIAGGVFTHGRRTIANQTAPTLSGTRAYDRFAPKFGLMVEPREGLTFFANFSKSVELPGYSELGQVQTGGRTGFVNLDPQRAWTIEIGGRGTLGPVAWDIALYRADLKGEMLQYNTATVLTVPAATFNAGRTRHQGVEAGLTAQLLPILRLRGSWNYSDFRFRGDAVYGNNRLPVVPKHVLKGEVRIGSDALHVAPVVEWVPRGAFVDYANTAAGRAPGYALVSVTAGATVADGIDLFMDVRNLTGKKAIGDMSAVAVPVTAATVAYYPVERRGVYGGVRAKF